MVQKSKNVLGEVLEVCSVKPLTGFTRSGSCETFSRARGNDLLTPVPEFDFPGLKSGDRWCVCAARWREAFEAGCAPHVVLHATHERTLDVVSLADLKGYAIDLN